MSENTNFQLDYYRMTGEKWSFSPKTLVNMLMHHNLRFMRLWRSYQRRKSPITRLRIVRMCRKYGLEISVGAEIGEGFYIGHPYNITVAEGVRIGRNVNLHKGCTIGRENRGKRQGVPTIGNNVYVGINAVIVGNITVGDDVLIAPNSFVNQDIPPHTVVTGNPAVLHPKEDATKDYVCFRV